VPISLTVFNAAAIEQQNFQGVESYFPDAERQFTSEGTRDRKQLSLRGVSDQLSPDNESKKAASASTSMSSTSAGHVQPGNSRYRPDRGVARAAGTLLRAERRRRRHQYQTSSDNDFFAEASAQYSSFNTSTRTSF